MELRTSHVRSRRFFFLATVAIAGLFALGGCGGSGGEAPGPNPGDANPPDVNGPDADAAVDAPVKPKVLTGPSHGSTIAISGDDTRIVTVNHDAGSITVLSVEFGAAGTPPTLAKVAEIPVGAEPWATVIDPNGDRAYVIVRKDQKLVRIDDLRGTPKKGAEVAVGSEPTGIAMTPMGKTVWVANWIDGTVMGIATETMKVTDTIDLNQTIAASSYLGKDLAPRPSLSHPRSVAITNNGDLNDGDEAMYVTEFYALQKTPMLPDLSNQDTNHVGVLYKIPLATKKAAIIELPPIDMGFQDYKGGAASCYPNQLQALTIQGGFGYVASVCVSPKLPSGLFMGPAAAVCADDSACPGAVAGSCVSGKCTTNCAKDADCGVVGGQCASNVCLPNPASIKTSTAPVISIVDLGGNKTIASTNLAKEFDKLYATRGTADAARRFPLHSQDISFVPGTVTAYFAANGADAVFRVDFNATYDASTVDGVGDAKHEYINLAPAGVDPSRVGHLPTGVVVANKIHPAEGTIRYAFSLNEDTRNVSVLDLANAEVAGLSAGTPTTIATAQMPTDAAALDTLEGKRLFNTGLGRWSYKGQALMACQTCHLDGLTDQIVYFGGRGPRQPGSIDGTVASKDPSDVRIMLSGNADELTDHEGGTRSLAGGVGIIVKDQALLYENRIPYDVYGHSGLNGSSAAAADPTNPAKMPVACSNNDWAKLVAYMRSIRSPRKPTNLDPAKVTTGQALFMEGKCQGCHSGPKWTISKVFYTPDPTGAVNKALSTKSWSAAASASGFPTSLWPATTPAMQMMRYAGTAKSDFDTLLCALRPVGTFGVSEPDVTVLEVRSKDMVTPAQGNDADVKGFNVPSLLNMAAGSPYFHAGNARTLEAAFGDAFKGHHQALNAKFLDATDPGRAEKVAALVQFVLSIDEDAMVVATPALGPDGGVLCAP